MQRRRQTPPSLRVDTPHRICLLSFGNDERVEVLARSPPCPSNDCRVPARPRGRSRFASLPPPATRNRRQSPGSIRYELENRPSPYIRLDRKALPGQHFGAPVRVARRHAMQLGCRNPRRSAVLEDLIWLQRTIRRTEREIIRRRRRIRIIIGR